MKPFSHQILIVFLVFQGLPQKPSWPVRNPCELNAAYVSFLIKHFNYIPKNMPLIKIETETDFYKNESFSKNSQISRPINYLHRREADTNKTLHYRILNRKKGNHFFSEKKLKKNLKK